MARLSAKACALIVASLALFSVSCNRCGQASPEPETPQLGRVESTERLVILGFDGVDPRWLSRWAAESKLPVLRRLIEAHGGDGFRPLGSTNPPQSPVAWTSFATGTRPGEHGIFDFLRRRLNDRPGGLPVYPAIGTVDFQVHEAGPPSARNLRQGIPFWKTLADTGVRTVALNIPYSFPPDPMKHGRMLSGLGVPDLRETNSTFTLAATDITPALAERPPGGGHLTPLTMERAPNGERTGTFSLEGPSIPGESGRMTVPVGLEATHAHLSLRVQGRQMRLTPNQWSPWTELHFEHSGRKVSGLARFLALSVHPEVRLFVTPIGFHPNAPYSPFSYPSGFAAEVVEWLAGFFKTVGWDHDTSALNAEVLTDSQFLDQVDQVERDRRQMLLRALDQDNWDLLIWVSTSTDRVAHMFYRLMDEDHPRYDSALAENHANAVEREYRRMDETVGLALKKLKPNDTLLILSDHGFHNFRRGLHVNQWLRDHGFLALRDGAQATDREFLQDVDWSQTKAYAIGTGQIYLNLKGREREGILSPEEAKPVLRAIRTGLRALRDEPEGGMPVVREVYFADDVFEGTRRTDAPDAQIAFHDGYRTSWETILGGVPEGLLVDNTKKWSGDHAASDVEETPGILISTQPLRRKVEIVDIAPSALAFFDEQAPPHYVGRSVWRNSP